jgi:fluoride exporter
MKELSLVFIGGGIGSVLRYVISIWLQKGNSNFPWPTFLTNALGCFLIGLLYAFLSKENNAYKLLLVTGFCGGFTTFSAFSFEVIQYIEKQQWNLALLYIFLSLLVCLVACALGYFLFK